MDRSDEFGSEGDPKKEDPEGDGPTVDLHYRESGVSSRIGRYSLRRRIASGGMGTVYEAIQDEPRRPVALKVVKADIAGPAALRRFQSEAQILARLRHPCIAQVYEAGTHDDGRGPVPFFAMEYIPNAKSITEFAESRKLGTRERLALFAQVCDAVHHGHQKGIVHRDLKPSNILVDSQGHPHVIDFGVARATDSDVAAATMQTEVGQLIGSVAYMSPEQFDADPGDLDTRSDVYALGVVLYELLGGKLPYDVLRTTVYEAARVVREEPPRRLGEVNPTYRGEVETIVHKALEKERDRRYQSAFGLAEDIRRYLGGQAIAAKPPSIGYHVRVFARRNKILLGAVAAVFLVLVGALATSTSLYLRAERERERAEREGARSNAAIDFIMSALESVTPKTFDDEPTIDDLMERLASHIDGAFPEDPSVEAEIRLAIARGTLALTDTHPDKWPAIEEQMDRALELRRQAFGNADPRTLEILKYQAMIYGVRGQAEKLVEARRAILDALATTKGAEDPTTLGAAEDLVDALGTVPLYEEAENLATSTLEARRRVLGEDDEATLRSWSQLVWLQLMRGRLNEAQTAASSLLTNCERLFGGDHQLTKLARSELAAANILQGNLSVARDLYRNRQVPADLGSKLTYQGHPTPPRDGTQLFVYWETWCPFSQRTVPSLEDVHVHFQDVDVVGLTAARPPSNDQKVAQFLAENGVTYPVLKIGVTTARALDATGTPWLVLSRDGWILWESEMEAPAPLVSNLLEGVARGQIG